jgi:hypothetical protein
MDAQSFSAMTASQTAEGAERRDNDVPASPDGVMSFAQKPYT